MHDLHSAPAVVVGVDGSPAESGAVVRTVDEAATRDTPLELVYVIHRADLLGADVGSEADQLAAARTAVADGRHAVEATGTTVKIETEVLRGNPLATLIESSRSAAMLCVGSIGIAHVCHRAGCTAAALAGSAGCPVAVIRHPDMGQRADAGHVVAEADASPENNAVLGWVVAEARLRGAPLRVITSARSQPGDMADGSSDRRIGRWTRQYPDVVAEPVAVQGSVAQFERAGFG